MWHYVFVSASGQVSVGSELRGRIPVYSHPDVRMTQRYARRLMSSRGAAWAEQTPSVTNRGQAINPPAHLLV